jgi:hypothetical protein
VRACLWCPNPPPPGSRTAATTGPGFHDGPIPNRAEACVSRLAPQRGQGGCAAGARGSCGPVPAALPRSVACVCAVEAADGCGRAARGPSVQPTSGVAAALRGSPGRHIRGPAAGVPKDGRAEGRPCGQQRLGSLRPTRRYLHASRGRRGGAGRGRALHGSASAPAHRPSTARSSSRSRARSRWNSSSCWCARSTRISAPVKRC